MRRRRRSGPAVLAAMAAAVAAALALPAGSGGAATAQVTATEEAAQDVPAATDTAPAVLSPSGAFLRSTILPGWGHVATGSLTRGAFYFGWEALNGWMIYKSHRRLGVARRHAALWEERVTADLLREGVAPEQVEAQLEGHPEVLRFRGLVDARAEQREDWLALGIFTLLVSGVDAFVSAHLRDFPEPLTVQGDPTTGAVEVSVRVPLGGW